MSLPDDMAESARIDGAGELRIFYRIYLPLVVPGLMTLGIFTFQSGWNNFMWPNIVLQKSRKPTSDHGVQVFQNADGGQLRPAHGDIADDGGAVLVLYVFMQKYFVQGVALGGVKD